MQPLRLKDGFPGEIMYVVPRPVLDKARSHPLVSPLTPTDIGWFPSARFHYRERPAGAPEHILIYCAEGSGWCEIDGCQTQSGCQSGAHHTETASSHLRGGERRSLVNTLGAFCGHIR